jgi:hypothetical protein
MAEIQVERKPRSHAGWLLGLLLLIAVLGAGWYFTMGPGAGTGTLDEGTDLEPPASMPGPQAPAQAPAEPSTPPPGTAPTPQRAP